MTDTQPAKRKAGRPLKQSTLDPVALANKAAELATAGKGAEQLAREAHIGEHEARVLMRTCKMTYTEFTEVFRSKAQGLIDRAMAELDGKIGDMNAAQLSITLGVLTDKLIALNPRQAPQSVHLHLHSGDRESLVGVVLGNAGKRSISPVTTPKELKREAPETVIDLEPHPAGQDSAAPQGDQGDPGRSSDL